MSYIRNCSGMLFYFILLQSKSNPLTPNVQVLMMVAVGQAQVVPPFSNLGRLEKLFRSDFLLYASLLLNSRNWDTFFIKSTDSPGRIRISNQFRQAKTKKWALQHRYSANCKFFLYLCANCKHHTCTGTRI
jgi:hypothetical protein